MGGRVERVRRAMVVATATLLSARAASALSNPNDFCTGNPCIISSDKTVNAGVVLDFGTRTVVLQKILTIANVAGGGVGGFTLKCGTFQITGAGQIKGNSGSGPGGSATIEALNDIQINGTTGIGAVRLTGIDGGTLSLTATNGAVSGGGRLNTTGDGLTAAGGTITIRAGTSVSYSGQITSPGGGQGGGGVLDIAAPGNITLSGLVDLTGGEVGAGELALSAGGNLTLGEVDMSASGEFGDAGLGDIEAAGNIVLAGRFRGRGADNGESCGDGADIDINAGGDLTLSAEIDISGRGLDCAGGFLSLDGNRIFLLGPLAMSGTGTQGDGGDLDVTALTLIRLAGTVELDGGDGGGGDLLFISDKDIEITGTIKANGRTTASPGSALVEFDAGGTLTVSGDIDASGGVSAPMGGGDITFGGCKVSITSTSLIKALGDGGSISVEGNDKITLRGVFQAGNGGNTIEFGPRANPPDLTGASFSPARVLVPNPVLVPCRVCDTNPDCNDNNACTSDVCQADGLACLHAPVTGTCSDANACTTGDTCVAGVCVGGAPPNCDDGKVCTADSCAAATGCVHGNLSGPCNDNNLCTSGDQCSAGNCVGAPITCSDGNPCTNDVCTAGVCSNPFNTAPCSDGSACTAGDQCDGTGTCVPGPAPNCDDGNACTVDSCDIGSGCQHVITGVGCADSDGDGVPDDFDPCTTLYWTPLPLVPPNQQPRLFGFAANRLLAPDGGQRLLIKGLFNSAPAPLAIDPAANGVHIYAADELGPLYDVSVPAGAGCGAGDGWTTIGVGFKKVWSYRNQSGALPPACTPGSALGITAVQIRDQRLASKHGLQFKVKMKKGSLLRDPVAPLTRVQVDFALAAQPSPGLASQQAKLGECAEALFTGNPIPSKGKPFCVVKQQGPAVDGVSCKGR